MRRLIVLGFGLLLGALVVLIAAVELLHAMVFGGSESDQIPVSTWEYVPWYSLRVLAAAAGTVAVWQAVPVVPASARRHGCISRRVQRPSRQRPDGGRSSGCWCGRSNPPAHRLTSCAAAGPWADVLF